MSRGTEQNLDSIFLARTTSTTYEELEDKPNGDHSVKHEEFVERPMPAAALKAGFKPTFPGKGDYRPLPVNKSASLKLAVYAVVKQLSTLI